MINSAGSRKFIDILENKDATFDTLTINSRGGDTQAVMQIGRQVFSHNLKLKVRKIYASSCANYIVTAAKSVLVESSRILDWHSSVFNIRGSHHIKAFSLKITLQLLLIWIKNVS